VIADFGFYWRLLFVASFYFCLFGASLGALGLAKLEILSSILFAMASFIVGV